MELIVSYMSNLSIDSSVDMLPGITYTFTYALLDDVPVFYVATCISHEQLNYQCRVRFHVHKRSVEPHREDVSLFADGIYDIKHAWRES